MSRLAGKFLLLLAALPGLAAGQLRIGQYPWVDRSQDQVGSPQPEWPFLTIMRMCNLYATAGKECYTSGGVECYQAGSDVFCQVPPGDPVNLPLVAATTIVTSNWWKLGLFKAQEDSTAHPASLFAGEARDRVVNMTGKALPAEWNLPENLVLSKQLLPDNPLLASIQDMVRGPRAAERAQEQESTVSAFGAMPFNPAA